MKSLFSILMFLLLVAPTAADVVPERPSRYVVDLANVVDDSVEARLDGYLQELEQKTTAQVLVLTVKSLDGGSIEDFSLQVAEKWRLGRKERDNGLLMLFAMQDRKYRFEVGYGLEGILPDSKVGSIGREFIVPFFRKGEYSNGIAAAALAVAEAIADDSGVKITGMPRISQAARRYGGGERGGGIAGTIFAFLFFIGVVYLFIRHPRFAIMLLLFSGMGGRRSHWGGGGGFGGGGFGGFGGGGGGGFGGGGASGSW